LKLQVQARNFKKTSLPISTIEKYIAFVLPFECHLLMRTGGVMPLGNQHMGEHFLHMKQINTVLRSQKQADPFRGMALYVECHSK
jgi:hypothetical protein